MSSLEGNKIAAAILVGGMITLSVGIVTDFIFPAHHAVEAAQEGEGGAAPAAPSGPAPVTPVLGLIAAADVAKGETVAKKCVSCHDFSSANANKVGPGLYGVVGRVSGTHEGFAYSEPMKAHAKPWTFEELNHFIANPKGYIPGTKMTFAGLPSVEDRAALFAWMRSQAASPAPLPTPEEIAAEQAAAQAAAPAEGEAAPAEPAAEATPAEGATQEAAAAPAETAPTDNAIAMIATADPAAGEKASGKCKACHDFSKDGKNKVGPHLWGVVGRNHAAVADFAYSDVMKGMADKPWNFEELDHFLANPKEYAPGTKMSFPGLKKPEERAALLRWLRDQSDSPVPLPQ